MLSQGSDFSRPKSALCLLTRGLESVKGETFCCTNSMSAVANRYQNLVKGCFVAPQRWGLRRKPNSWAWPERCHQLGLSPPVNKPQTKLGQTSLQSFYLYLRNNLDSIVDYQTYRRKGYFISSVWVEKTIDLLICRRLKLRGQNWSRQGAENMVTFRQLILNGHWKSCWQQQKAP